VAEPLGDKIIQLLMYVFAVTWGLGWVFLLLIMLFEKLFPNFERKGEGFLKSMGKFLSPVMKYSLIAVGILILIQFLATWLGWTK
jgi:cytochrome c biogenesis protein CcdA